MALAYVHVNIEPDVREIGREEGECRIGSKCNMFTKESEYGDDAEGEDAEADEPDRRSRGIWRNDAGRSGFREAEKDLALMHQTGPRAFSRELNRSPRERSEK